MHLISLAWVMGKLGNIVCSSDEEQQSISLMLKIPSSVLADVVVKRSTLNSQLYKANTIKKKKENTTLLFDSITQSLLEDLAVSVGVSLKTGQLRFNCRYWG